MQLIVSDAGAKSRDVWLELRDNDFGGAVYDSSGERIFEQTLAKPLGELATDETLTMAAR